MVTISGHSLPIVNYPGIKIPVYPHQAMVLSRWREADNFLLVTKTGSGKTAAATLPLIQHKQSAVLVYPTNELIRDQARSITALMDREGVTYKVLEPDTIDEKYGDETFHLLHVDADRIKAFARAFRLSEKNRAAALIRLIKPERPKIILINPDLLYLFYSLRFHKAADILAHFQAYQTIVFDEFHLYAGVELSHILFLIHTARSLKAFKRVVILTATPSQVVRDLIDRVLECPMEITGDIKIEFSTTGSRAIAHDIQLIPKLLEFDNIASQIADELDGLKEAIKSARRENFSNDFVPAVVIINSVIQAIRLEDELVDRGWRREDIGVIHGLTARSSRTIVDKLIILGTSAIEVGIDFKTDILIFQAGDGASFIQRFGRLGRHRPGKAILFCNAREYGALSSIDSRLDRSEFEKKIFTIYGESDTMAWFVRSISGALTMSVQAEHIRKIVSEDRNLDENTVEEIGQWINTLIMDFAKLLNMEREFQSAQGQFMRIKKLPWLQAYMGIISFRTSMPSVEIFDWSQKERGCECTYTVDVSTLLSWAQNSPRYKRETNSLYINGYSRGKPHAVWTDGLSPDDSLIGGWFSTGEDQYKTIRLVQDGHLTSISHLMTLRPHLFTIIPFEMTKNLDWRIQTFRIGAKGRYALAFDGAALLVKEIWKERQIA